MVRASFAALFMAAATATAQQQPLVSPEVKPDRTVVFRIAAPKATVVTVSGEFGKKELTKDDRGVWSATVGPLEPDLYSYQFNVDGVPTADPRNGRVKVGSPPLSNLVEVKGDKPGPHDLRPVPHGTLHFHRYESKALDGKSRGLVVYTPPGYELRADQHFPVLYLLHGSGDNEFGWTDIGMAHHIVDNLLADGKATPMIIVMPNGHAVERRTGQPNANNTQKFEADLLGDVIPLVKKTYRVKPGQENCAIAGLSMGGGQSWAIGMGHLDMFAYVCPFSMGGGSPGILDKIDPAEVNKRLKLIWIGCGKDDRGFARSEKLCQDLTAKGVKNTWHPSDGAHTWIVWRKYLAEVVPLLFR
jgi:enterochelin esterase family protein